MVRDEDHWPTRPKSEDIVDPLECPQKLIHRYEGSDWVTNFAVGRPSRRGGLLPRASHRTGLVGPHPALQADCLKTTSVVSWPPPGESRANEHAD